MFPSLRQAVLSWVAVPLLFGAGPSLALPLPEGEVILIVSGDIEHTNSADGEAHFDDAMLMSLSTHVIETHTPWSDGKVRYEGPLGRAVLDAVGARGELLTARALDGFSAEIPVADFHDYDVILSLRRNGEPMPIRERGPVFVLYPFDEHPELLNETIRFRSVWQLTHIHVE